MFPVVLVLGALVLTGLQIHGSSIGALDQKRTDDPSLLLGQPRTIRSDEWLLTSPEVIGSDRRGLLDTVWVGLTRTFLPASGLGTPSWHWSEIFHPNDWGFFLLPTEAAFAWRWWVPLLAGLIGVYALLLQLTRRPLISAGLASVLALSPYSAWWSSSPSAIVGYLSATAACVIHGMSRPRLLTRIGWGLLAGFFATTAGLIMYPPWLVSVGLVILAVIVGVAADRRVGWLRFGTVSVSTLAVFVPAMLQWSREALPSLTALAGTIYPGSRLSPSGGASMRWLLNAPASLWWSGYPGSGRSLNVGGHEVAANGLHLFTNVSEASSTWLPLPLALVALLAALLSPRLLLATTPQRTTMRRRPAPPLGSAMQPPATASLRLSTASLRSTGQPSSTDAGVPGPEPSLLEPTASRGIPLPVAGSGDGAPGDTIGREGPAPVTGPGHSRAAKVPAEVPTERPLRWTPLLVAGVMLLLLGWALLPLPSWVGAVTLLNRVPGYRTPLALGLAMVLLLATAATVVGRARPRWWFRLLAVLGGGATAAAMIWATKTLHWSGGRPAFRNIIVLGVLAGVGFTLLLLGRRLSGAGAVLTGLLAAAVFVPVNPVYRGLGPMDDDPVVAALRPFVTATGQAPKATVYGGDPLLNALVISTGMQSLTGLTVYPDRAFWERVDPGQEKLWNNFNKYAWTVDLGVDTPVIEPVSGTQRLLRVNPCSATTRQLGIEYSVSSTPLDAVRCLVLVRSVPRSSGTVYIYRYAG